MPARAVVTVLVLITAFTGCGDGGPFRNAVDTAATTAPAPSDTPVATTDSPDETDGTDDAVGTKDVVAGIDFGILDLPPAEPYDDYTELVDDTDTVMVEVPTAWPDVETAPREVGEAGGADPVEYPYLAAYTDFEGFYNDGVEPGVVVSNYPYYDSEQGQLDRVASNDNLDGHCEAVDAFDYDDGSYTGLTELWTGCDDKQAAKLVISTLVDDDHLLVEVQLLTEADIDAAARIIETFSFTGE